MKFSSDISRIFYFTFESNTFVLLHGFTKKSDKTPKEELEKALNYKEDYERAKQNITQEELALRVGTQKSNISRLESGTYNPSLDFLIKVARSLGKEMKITIE